MRLDSGAKAFSLPIGTLLGCTFNRELNQKLFEDLSLEMITNRVDCLLGPGMNIHRHILNGRNFEYFSEDPYLTGEIAAAQLKGLKRYGQSGTVKHFAANNQEYRRRHSDSVVSDRALRRLYAAVTATV
jgi:beta-glucosidase